MPRIFTNLHGWPLIQLLVIPDMKSLGVSGDIIMFLSVCELWLLPQLVSL